MNYIEYMNRRKAGLLLRPEAGSKLDMKDRVLRGAYFDVLDGETLRAEGGPYLLHNPVESQKSLVVSLSPPTLDPFMEITESHPFSAEGSQIFDIGFANGVWVIVGHDTAGGANIKYSSDGTVWQDGFGDTFAVSCNGVTFDNNLWVAVGQSEKLVSYSADGIHWTYADETPLGDANKHFNHVAFGNGLWVAVGFDNLSVNTIYYSPDNARTWSPCSGTMFGSGGRGMGVTFSSGKWVATGENVGGANILVSTDGINWTTAPLSFPQGNGSFVDSHEGFFVAVGADVASDTILYSSGSNWLVADGFAHSSSEIAYGYGVRYANGLWVATGSATNGENILFSLNGMDWTAVSGTPFGVGGHGYAVASSASKWIAVGADETGATKILCSSSSA